MRRRRTNVGRVLVLNAPPASPKSSAYCAADLLPPITVTHTMSKQSVTRSWLHRDYADAVGEANGDGAAVELKREGV